ncbi:MAG: hypothetical protein ACLRU1_06830 [Veillonella parvula]
MYAIQNPELRVYIFAYSNSAIHNIQENMMFKTDSRLIIWGPGDFESKPLTLKEVTKFYLKRNWGIVNMEYCKKIGVIITVDGNVSQVGLYDTTNDTDVFWYGDILSGAKVGAFVTIHQNMVKIIATVVS